MVDLTFEPGMPKAFSVSDLLKWITESQNRSLWHLRPPLTLPALQRNGTWRPKQVLDLWRSVLEGMPIGLFYLQRAKDAVVDPECRTKLFEVPSGGALDLFDGQQRVRALALGAGDPFKERRCIWIRFEDETYELILSSQAQPAGYKTDGGKLSVKERSDKLIPLEGATLPYPFGCSPDNTRRLVDLLGPLLVDRTATVDEGMFPCNTSAQARNLLRQRSVRLSQPCAVCMLLPDEITADPNKTLDLFRRIGAGGTPLSQAEQVYSAYKLTRPAIRGVVETIHDTVSAILTPAQIIQAALRMAYVQAKPNTGWIPGPEAVIKELKLGEKSQQEWVKKLGVVLDSKDGDAPLTRAFRTVRDLLSKKADADPFYLPEIVLAQLPSELWQVLAFWAVLGGRDTRASREEAIRFALAWHLAVTHDEHAAQVCFRRLVSSQPGGFPGCELFKELVLAGRAHRIPPPEALTPLFQRATRGDPYWLNHEERFPAKATHRDIASTWWFSRKILPWLQREYLERHFAHYRALSDHEDDLPYDWDHICPRAHWGPDGRTVGWEVMGFPNKPAWERNMGQPWMVGDAIGNMRLVDFRQNRSDSDDGIFAKMPFLCSGSADPNGDSARSFLMEDADTLPFWKKVDESSDHRWTSERLEAFQRAVEQRTARLYDEFFNQLGFKDWPQIPFEE